MNGSVKQVTWAEQIKPALLREAAAAMEGMLAHREAAVAAGAVDGEQVALERAGGEKALALMAQVAEAGWWITRRNARPGQALRDVARWALTGQRWWGTGASIPNDVPGVADLRAFWRIAERL